MQTKKLRLQDWPCKLNQITQGLNVNCSGNLWEKKCLHLYLIPRQKKTQRSYADFQYTNIFLNAQIHSFILHKYLATLWIYTTVPGCFDSSGWFFWSLLTLRSNALAVFMPFQIKMNIWLGGINLQPRHLSYQLWLNPGSNHVLPKDISGAPGTCYWGNMLMCHALKGKGVSSAYKHFRFVNNFTNRSYVLRNTKIRKTNNENSFTGKSQWVKT
jgi:hypothetical protein